MDGEYNNYLARIVLNDEKIVTFRALSRAFEISCNEAKRLLFEFHRHENEKRAGSVHATYMVTGYQNSTESVFHAGEAVVNRVGISSKHKNSSASNERCKISGSYEKTPAGFTKTLTLVDEARLESLRGSCAKILSLHVYSLQPAPLKNLDTISLSHEKLHEQSEEYDLLLANKKYGSIKNPGAQRRAAHKHNVAASSQSGDTFSGTFARTIFQPNEMLSDTEDSKACAKLPAARKETSSFPKHRTSGSSTQKKESGMFRSFTKAKPSEPNATIAFEAIGSSAKRALSMPVANLPTQQGLKPLVDVNMEGKEGNSKERLIAPISTNKKTLREDQKADLHKQIFDDSDEEEEREDKNNEENSKERAMELDASDEVDEGFHEKLEEENWKAENDLEKEKPTGTQRSQDGSSNDEVASMDESFNEKSSRRRGRRRIIRKRMIKDPEGYLVTKEEPGWESFSEEEVSNTQPTPASSSTPRSSATASKTIASSTAAAKKGLQWKTSQGNIMSFFGKK